MSDDDKIVLTREEAEALTEDGVFVGGFKSHPPLEAARGALASIQEQLKPKRAEHTPGPWKVDDSFTIRTLNGLLVAEAWHGADEPTPDMKRAEANAHVIATAPEMLAELEREVKLVPYSPMMSPVEQSAFDRKRALIAKAKGES